MMSARVLDAQNFNLLPHWHLNPFFKKVADRIRDLVDEYQQAFPTVLEIPSKEHAYDPEKVRLFVILMLIECIVSKTNEFNT